MEIHVGMVVREHKWGRHTGTVQDVNPDSQSAFVAWHGTCVEDEIEWTLLEPIADPTPEQLAWKGRVMVLEDDQKSIRPIGHEPA